MDMTMLNTAPQQILNSAAKIVWKQMGYDINDLPEVTPDKLRQWMPKLSLKQLDPFQHVAYPGYDYSKIPKKTEEPGNWVEKTWYRLLRCQLQHAVDAPTPTDETIIAGKVIIRDPKEFITTMTTNKKVIHLRTITSAGMYAIFLRWNSEPIFALLKHSYGVDSLEDGVVAIHELWKEV